MGKLHELLNNEAIKNAGIRGAKKAIQETLDSGNFVTDGIGSYRLDKKGNKVYIKFLHEKD